MGIAFVLFLSVLMGILPAPASANTPAYNGDKVEVVVDDDTEPVGAQYSFIPQFTASTKAIPFGSNLWRNTQWSAGDSRKFHSIELTNPTNRDGLKGKIGIKYTNVGSYNGTPVDLKITVTNWSRFGLPGKSGLAARVGNISFEDRKIALSTQGYHFVDTTWQYFMAGTNTPVKVAGYFTFSDVDLTQSIQLSQTSAANIDRYLIEDRTNKLRFTTVASQHKFFDVSDVDVNDTVFDHRYAFTFLYSDLQSFSLRWQTDWYNTKNSYVRGGKLTSSRYYYTNTRDYAVGEYMFFVINKPGETLPPKPPKPPATEKGPTMIEIWTTNVGKGIRQRVNVFDMVGSNLNPSDYDSGMASFEVKDSTGQVVHTTSFGIANFPKAYEFTAASGHLAKDAKTNYTYTLIVPKKKTQYYQSPYSCGYWTTYMYDHDGDPKTPNVQGERWVSRTCYETLPVLPIPTPTTYTQSSYGYTSSEKAFKATTPAFDNDKGKFSYDAETGDFHYEAYVKTTKFKNGSMQLDREITTMTFPQLSTMKTGYKFGPKISAIYRNELSTPDTMSQHLERIESDFLVDKRLVDTHLDEEYKQDATYPDKLAIPLRDAVDLTSRDKKQQQMQLSLPFTHVERVTGELYTDKQVAAGKAKKGIAGIERKLFAPIWLDITGTYRYGYKSTKPIGVHDFSFDIQDNDRFTLDFIAHMYSHSDSATPGDDELLIHPLLQGGWGVEEVTP